MKEALLVLAISTCLFVSAAIGRDVRFDGWPDLDSNLDVIIPLFEAVNEDVSVTYQMNNHGDHHKKLTTNLATGSGAGDVVAIDVGFVGSFINQGGFENLSAKKYGAGELTDKFVAYAWEQGKGIDGNQYAIPFDIGPGVMYYRRDILELVDGEINEIITDWESYISFGKRLKEDGIFLIADASDVAKTIVLTTVQKGEGYYFDVHGHSLITSDRFVRAFETAKRIRDAGLDAQIGAWSNEWYDSFKNGSVATQLSGAWLVGHMQNWMAPNTSGKWGVSNLPGGIYGSWGGSFLAIPKQAKNKQAAWNFIKYLTTNKEVQISALRTIGAFPVMKETYDDEVFGEPIEFLAGQKARHLFAEIAQKITPVTPHYGDLIAEDIVLNGALSEVLNEGKNVMQALKDAEQLVLHRVK